jgi:hypothetical protein
MNHRHLFKSRLNDLSAGCPAFWQDPNSPRVPHSSPSGGPSADLYHPPLSCLWVTILERRMMKYLNAVSLLVLLTTMLVMGIGPVHSQADLSEADEADSEAGLQPSGNHCVVQVSPVQPGQRTSAIEEVGCFETFSEAIFAATEGEVNLHPTSQPFDVTEEMLVSVAVTVYAVDYEHKNYGGKSYIWTTASVGCTSTQSFAAARMPSGWNDILSSTRGFAGCYRNILYEDANYLGASQICTPDCSLLGVMNDKTSSRRWKW